MNTSLPDKSLGQHWLKDQATLRSICEFAGIGPGDTVLEVGPGLGTLTDVLLQYDTYVHAVEFDETLARLLAQRATSPRLVIEHADILRFDLSALPATYNVVANVPYYITSAIIRKLITDSYPPKSATLLVQKEVAERLAAPAGSASLLSISAQFYTDVRLGPVVPAALFTPPPKVDSQAVRLDYVGPRFTDIAPKAFFRVVKAGFGERRKKLRSSLSGGLQLSKKQADILLEDAGITAATRAQELTLEDWHRLTLCLQ